MRIQFLSGVSVSRLVRVFRLFEWTSSDVSNRHSSTSVNSNPVTASHPGRYDSSTKPLWEPELSNCENEFLFALPEFTGGWTVECFSLD